MPRRFACGARCSFAAALGCCWRHCIRRGYRRAPAAHASLVADRALSRPRKPRARSLRSQAPRGQPPPRARRRRSHGRWARTSSSRERPFSRRCSLGQRSPGQDARKRSRWSNLSPSPSPTPTPDPNRIILTLALTLTLTPTRAGGSGRRAAALQVWRQGSGTRTAAAAARCQGAGGTGLL